jgi:hypothetical protein
VGCWDAVRDFVELEGWGEMGWYGELLALFPGSFHADTVGVRKVMAWIFYFEQEGGVSGQMEDDSGVVGYMEGVDELLNNSRSFDEGGEEDVEIGRRLRRLLVLRETSVN